MEENNKSGFSAEGRKLRPRRPRISGKVYSSTEGPAERRRSYGDSDNRRSSYGSSERRSYGNSERRSSYGHSSYGHGQRSGGYGNSESRPYGNSEGRSFGRSSYGSGSRSEGRSFGNGGHQDRRSFGNNSGRRTFEGRPSGNYENRSFGKQESRSFGNQEGRSFGPSGRRAFNGNREGGRDNSFRNRKPAGRGFATRNAGKGPARKQTVKPNPYKFNETDEQNMNMMLSRKPQLDQIQISDNDYVETPIKETIRLNKFIANSGICSRREADQYIQAGVVTVNGEVVTELGTKVNVLNDDIRFNGERLRGEEKVYIVMNKPKGFVTTASDPHADKTVMDLLKNCKARVFPVGRLDKNTTGVLMFTNDGEIAERLTHPSYDKKKIYQVILDKPLTQEDFDKVLSGITLSDGDINADELEYIDAEDHRKLGIEIHSGKNRIVRRIFESLGYEVKALDRVYFAGLTKKGLKKGEWRYLSEGESNVLKMGAYA